MGGPRGRRWAKGGEPRAPRFGLSIIRALRALSRKVRSLPRPMFTDRAQHTRYLTYLKKYEYFGRGKQFLRGEDFQALEAELAALDREGPEAAQRRRDILAILLQD